MTSTLEATSLNSIPRIADNSISTATAPLNSVSENDSSDVYDSATIIKLPIHLTQVPSARHENERNTMDQRNVSMFHSDIDVIIDDEEEFELPAELVAMIANAKSQHSSPAAAPTLGAVATAIRYYPTYSEGELCSSKSSSSFESWEESYASLEDCCEIAFSWDYDSCMEV
eukprot:CAMPEP_0183752824 /NCGR_PEP_ID=MMETSP0739-20130205/2570_1 /TAXON_ID=385413 /ORGANISM="Thalassiosira miniscula, Strain CCMP1093" /LENGTH=170 /DNA_ID=CAMNT_0025989229 /DNA_START=161 /DNA_END=673 /DNA_ORIENTATION=+